MSDLDFNITPEMVDRCWQRIIGMGELSEKLQLVAIKASPSAFFHIKNPTEKVQMTFIRENPIQIKHIKNPSKKLQRLAVRIDSQAIEGIEDPDEEIQMLAVKDNEWTLQHIFNPTDKVALYAAKKNYHMFDFLTMEQIFKILPKFKEEELIEVVKTADYILNYIEDITYRTYIKIAAGI